MCYIQTDLTSLNNFLNSKHPPMRSCLIKPKASQSKAYPMLKLTSFSPHMIFTVSSEAALMHPHDMVWFFIALRSSLMSCMCSGGTWIISPSSTMLDLAVRPLDDFRAPLNTIKLAPVTTDNRLIISILILSY